MSGSAKSLPVLVIACKVMESMFLGQLSEELAQNVTYMDYGLHRHPQRMTWTLQDAIDSVQTPSLIVLGYGLCGNGLNRIKAGPHTLLIPRADDCIAMLLGSRAAYMQQFEANPGTYYLSKGWLESGSHPLKEYLEYRETYGEEDAAWIMDQQYQHYERLVFVAHSQEELEAYRPQALEVARYCERWGMRYEEILGSDAFVRRLLQAAANPDSTGDDFIIIPPGGQIRQEQFI